MTTQQKIQQRLKRGWRLILLFLVGGVGYLVGIQPFSVASPHRHLDSTVVLTRSLEENPAVGAKDRAMAAELSSSFEAAAGAVSPSVVPIYSEQVVQNRTLFGQQNGIPWGDEFFKKFFGNLEPQNQTVRGIGSGVIVSSDGYILTNNHVVDGAQKLWIVLNGSKKIPAEVIGRDPQTDVAVIKVDEKNLPVAILGNSDNVRVGEWVIAIGNPFRLIHSVTAGIISAKGRSHMGLADYEDFIQTDAAINPGNSGGALADLNGNVIGINTAINSPSGGNVGIGFAIPINMAKSVMEQLISKGTVSRGFLALIPQDIDDGLAKALHLSSTKGALVGDVTADGPADKGGIRRGDVIVSFNGKQVENATELRQIVAEAKPGSTATVGIMRDGKQMDEKVVLGERPKGRGATGEELNSSGESSKSQLGLSVEALTPQLASQLGFENEQGVVVDQVNSGSPAEEAGIVRGDLIKEIDREPVKSISDFRSAISNLHSGDVAAFLVRRGDATIFVGVEIP